MPILVLDDLLTPIPGDSPCGSDLRLEAEWDKLQSLRGSDREAWEAGGKREAKWQDLKDFTAGLTQNRSKDLRITAYFVEACCRLYGFPGVSESLRVVRELIQRFWDTGLHPLPVNGNFEVRAVALEWYNEKFGDLLSSIPLIPSLNGQGGYSFGHYQEAQAVGWERNTRDANGDFIEEKRRAFTQRLASGLISLDMYSAALEKIKRKPVEQLNEAFQETLSEFRLLDKAIEDAFKPAGTPVKNAPSVSLSGARLVLEEIGSQIEAILLKKRTDEPDVVPGNGNSPTAPGPSSISVQFALPVSGLDSGDSWAEAEAMIKAGEIDEGLARMSRLAANETSGRSRFYRKLLLAEVCISRGRDRLARTILEELNEQIDKHHLDVWETPQWAGTVWSRLYRIYRKTEPDADRTKTLYKRLSSADPWQALAIPEE